MDVFTVADLFVVGIALDLVGAYLHSRGLLASHPILALRATSYWDGNPHTAVGLAEDRVDGRFGVRYLVLGFAVQVVGYVLDLAFDPSADASAARAFVALVLAVAAGTAAYGLWRHARPDQLKRTLVEIAHYDTSRATERPLRRDGPYLGQLLNLGRAAGYPADDHDSERSYARRVFGVTEGRPERPGGHRAAGQPRPPGSRPGGQL
jgi:hypothetical protein